MKTKRSQLREMIKEELEVFLRESSSFDAPKFSDTKINTNRNSKEHALISSLMDYLEIDNDNATGLVEPIKKLASKLSVDKIMNKIIDLSKKDPATKNLFLTHLGDIGFDFHSPTSLKDVEPEYNKWQPKKSIK
tara:strand:- start:1058 stop:1459 length:402 start_codon:yes stop_codon:yes gene_type:complete